MRPGRGSDVDQFRPVDHEGATVTSLSVEPSSTEQWFTGGVRPSDDAGAGVADIAQIDPPGPGWVTAAVEPALRSAVERLPGPVRGIAGYHLGWCDEAGRPAGG